MSTNIPQTITKKKIFFSFLLQFLGLGLMHVGSKHWSKWLYSFLFAISILPIFLTLIIGYNKEGFIRDIAFNSLLSVFLYPVLIFEKTQLPFIYHFLGLTYWLIGFIDLTCFFFKKDFKVLRTSYLSFLSIANFLWLFQISHYDTIIYSIGKYREGLTAVCSNKKCGFINRLGIEVIPLQYDNTTHFSNGLAVVGKNNLYGVIDKKGAEITKIEYDNIIDYFFEGFAKVKKNNLFGLIDNMGKEIIAVQYSDVSNFSDGLACVKKDKLWGFIDKGGKTVIPFQYDNEGYFSEGLAPIKTDSLWGFIDKTGKQIIEPQYSFVYSFSEGLAPVKKGNLWGFIDKTGKLIINLQYNFAYSFSKGLASVSKNGEDFFFINKKGEYVKDCPE